jgi:hypothetical protein
VCKRQASDGNLYGTTQGDTGPFENGVPVDPRIDATLFQLSPGTGTLLTLYDFCSVGCGESNFIYADSVIQGNDGNLYGIANSGMFFRYNLISPTAPAISATSGVVNGASFQTGIAAGSWLTVNGKNLSTTTGTWANSIVNGALPTTLDGVSVIWAISLLTSSTSAPPRSMHWLPTCPRVPFRLR